MKLKRILAMPFALVADVATLGNMGERSFTQQLFDAERREREDREVERALRLVIYAAQHGLINDPDDHENPHSCR